MSPSRILLLLTLMLVGWSHYSSRSGFIWHVLFILLGAGRRLPHGEGSPLFFAQEAENRFWTVVATLLSSVVFFAEDSPLRIGHKSPLAGCHSSSHLHVLDQLVRPLAATTKTGAGAALRQAVLHGKSQNISGRPRS